MTKVAVDVLKSVRIADGDPIYGREIVKGTTDEIPAALFDGLAADGYVAKAGKAPAKSKATAPAGTDTGANGGSGDDDAKAKAEEEAKAKAAIEAELNALTVAQLKDLAEKEEVTLTAEDNKKAEIVDKIVASRLAAAEK